MKTPSIPPAGSKSQHTGQRTLTRKIIGLIAAFAIPLTILSVYFLLTGLNKDINFATQEKRGDTYQRKLEPLLRLIPEQKLLLERITGGDAAARPQLATVESNIERAFGELATVDGQLGKVLLMTPEGLAGANRTDVTVPTVKKKWDTLRAAAGSMTTEQVTKEFTGMISDVRLMITHVGDKSNLILDPDLDSYYMMDITLNALPQNQDRLAALTSYVAGLPETPSAEQRTELAARLALLKEADLDRLATGVTTSLAEDKNFYKEIPDFQSRYPGAFTAYRERVEKVLTLGNSIAVGGKGTPQELQAALQEATAESFRFWDTSVGYMDVLLDTRLDAFQGKLVRSIVVALAGLVGAGIVAWFITRGLVGSFGQILNAEAAARSAAEEEKRLLQEQIQALLVVVSDGSDGKLDARARVTEGALGNMADALNLMFENVGDLISSAQTASDRVAQAARQISATTTDLSVGADAQTTEVAHTSAGVQLLNQQAQLVVNNCRAATAAVANARSAAENGALAVREVVEGMKRIRENVQVNAKKIKRLGDRSMEISGIVKAIGEISAKTDMLALNASMEAARAGEQGKGFSVIAEQVRSLAERTRTLTAEIERLVGSIQSETAEAVQQMETQTQEVENGSKQVAMAGEALEKIVHASAENSTLVSEISASATQQAERTSAMLGAVATIHSIAESARVKVLETSTTSEQLSELSAKLNRELAKFEVQGASGLN